MVMSMTFALIYELCSSGTRFMDVPLSLGLRAFGLGLVLLRLPVFAVRKFLEIAVNTMETFSKTFFAKSLLSMSLLKSLNYITLSTCRAADWACLRRTAKNFLVSIFGSS